MDAQKTDISKQEKEKVEISEAGEEDEGEEKEEDCNIETVVVFEKNIKTLIAMCRKINTIHQNNKLINSRNVIMDSLDNFETVYNKIDDPLKSLPLFEEVYSKKKISILSGSKDWIRDSLFVEYPKTKKAKRRMALMISIFYGKADELSETAQREMNEYNDDKNADNLFLTEELELPLLEIFLLVCKPEEKKILTGVRNAVRKELPGGNVNSAMPAGLGSLGGLGGLVGSLLGGLNLSELQAQANQMNKGAGEGSGTGGGEGGGGGEGLSSIGNMGEDQINQYIGSILDNPKTKTTISKVVNSCKNINSLADVGNVIGGLMQDGDLAETMKQLLPQPVNPNDMINEAKEKCPDTGSGESGEGKGKESE